MIPRWAVLVLCMFSLAALSGCQTTKKSDEEIPKLATGTVIPFTPQANTVPLNLESGAYPTLYSGTSYATWVTPAMGEMASGEADDAMPAVDPSTANMAASFLVIECHLASEFADMSIAYDVVGLRGASVYLETPGGERVMPSQIVVGQELRESQHGALRAYGRTNVLLFPRSQSTLTITSDLAKSNKFRLVIEAHSSVFVFAWQPVFPGTLPPPPLAQREGVQRFRSGYQSLFGKVRGVSHTFD